jgi:SAM-dependent methyltransferase
MAKYESLDWYSTPLWYDLVFEEDTKKEADFLEEAMRRYAKLAPRRGRASGRGSARSRGRLLEPASGSGRLVEEMARRGWDVTGFDASPEMLEFTRRRLARAGLRATLKRARLESFRLPGRFDVAHCFVSTFKYLLDERSAREHLRRVAAALRPGGLYLLGFHLSDYRWPLGDHERWVARRGATKVVCNIKSWPPSRRTRLEKVRSRLLVETRGKLRRTETTWWFRTYDAEEVRALLRSVPELEHLATYDFHYDWKRPRTLDDRQLDTLLILRRR